MSRSRMSQGEGSHKGQVILGHDVAGQNVQGQPIVQLPKRHRQFSNERFLRIISYFSVTDSQKEKKLYNAAKVGNLEEVKELLKTTFVNGNNNEYGLSPIIIAGNFF